MAIALMNNTNNRIFIPASRTAYLTLIVPFRTAVLFLHVAFAI